MKLSTYRPTSTQAMAVALVALVIAAWGSFRGYGASPAALDGAHPPRTIRVNTEEAPISKGPAAVLVSAKCPPGARLISGGFALSDTATAYVVQSYAVKVHGVEAWDVEAINPGFPAVSFPGTVTSQAICSLDNRPLVP